MRIPKGVRDNLRFLIAEVGSQVSHLQTFLEKFSVTVARRILDRSGYVNNLKMRTRCEFSDWKREPGKTGRKDAYLDIPEGRLVRKVRTGMMFL